MSGGRNDQQTRNTTTSTDAREFTDNRSIDESVTEILIDESIRDAFNTDADFTDSRDQSSTTDVLIDERIDGSFNTDAVFTDSRDLSSTTDVLIDERIDGSFNTDAVFTDERDFSVSLGDGAINAGGDVLVERIDGEIVANALSTARSIVTDGLGTSERIAGDALALVEDGQERILDFAGETTRDTVALAGDALGRAFSQTLAGQTEQNQRTVLIVAGLGMAAVVAIAFRG